MEIHLPVTVLPACSKRRCLCQNRLKLHREPLLCACVCVCARARGARFLAWPWASEWVSEAYLYCFGFRLFIYVNHLGTDFMLQNIHFSSFLIIGILFSLLWCLHFYRDHLTMKTLHSKTAPLQFLPIFPFLLHDIFPNALYPLWFLSSLGCFLLFSCSKPSWVSLLIQFLRYASTILFCYFLIYLAMYLGHAVA